MFTWHALQQHKTLHNWENNSEPVLQCIKIYYIIGKINFEKIKVILCNNLAPMIPPRWAQLRHKNCLATNFWLPTSWFRGRKRTPKNLCDKDFAERSGELSGVICLKTLVLFGSALKLFRKIIWYCSCNFGASFWLLKDVSACPSGKETRNCNCNAKFRSPGVANPFAPYRGQNPQNREKRVSESKNPHFPPPQKRGLWVKKSPFLYRALQGKWGFVDSEPPFLGWWEMGVFGLRNPLFPILGILTPVGGKRIRNTWCHNQEPRKRVF